MLTLKNDNEVIASYVTAGPRIHLNFYLDKLQEKALYCDTDSVVYIQPRNETGLVETASEIKPCEHTCELVGAGLENYAYKTLNPVTGEQVSVCKVWGIALNYNASQLVKFEKLKK